jgi:transcriptional regulator with XRE-family HTH domain
MPVMAKPIGREIGEKLRQIAHARGLTQGQVGANAHVSQPTVSQLFNGGTADPPIGTVLKIAKVLGVTLDEIVGLKPLQMPEPVSEGDLRQELADTRRQFAQALEQIANRVDSLADRLEAQPPAEAPKQKRAGQQRSA